MNHVIPPEDNLYLIGYRCTGKTGIGRRMAHRLRRPFTDCDQALADAGQSVRDIIAAEGWSGFRLREQRTLHAISLRKGMVVATGGGVVLHPVNITRMCSSGIVVWLTATPATIRERMMQDHHTTDLRPALTNAAAADEIESVLESRLPAYIAAADIRISTDGRTMAGIAAEIVCRLSQRTARTRAKRRTTICRAHSDPCSG